MEEPQPAVAAVAPYPPQLAPPAAAQGAAAPVAVARTVYETTKKKQAVVIDGFVMIKHFVSANGRVQHWRCEAVNRHKCNARGESAVDSTAVVMREKYARHNHEASATALKIRKLQNDVKADARRHQTTSAATIVDAALQGADEDVVLEVPRENLLRIVSTARRLEGARHVNRGNVNDIVFPDVFKTTAVGDQFLLVDSRTLRPRPPSVFFIFASPTQLRELRHRQHWAVDGTFYCTPTHFDSVFTIHVHVEHSSVPVAYFLLQDRKEDTYTRALSAFVAAADIRFVEPASIMSDFEVGAINALRATFPTTSIRLCLFHLAQSVFKNISEVGLVRLYRDNARARQILRCFPALAAVPPEDVVEGLHVIVDELTRMLVAGEIERDWEASLAGWHHAFNNTFSAPHLSLDKFIYRLKNDEDTTRQRLLRHEVLPALPIRQRRRQRYLVADNHLLKLARRYAEYRANGDMLRYLRCVQFHLQKPRFPGEPPDVAEDPLEEVAEGEDGGADDDAQGDRRANDRHLPRRESHPGDHHGFEAEEDDDGGVAQAMHAGRAGNAGPTNAGGQLFNAEDDILPGFSQADGVSVQRRGQLPSQSTSAATATTSACARLLAAADVSRRPRGRASADNGRRLNGPA